MIVYNNQQQLTKLCSFQEDFVLLQSPLRNNGNQGHQAIIRLNVAFNIQYPVYPEQNYLDSDLDHDLNCDPEDAHV